MTLPITQPREMAGCPKHILEWLENHERGFRAQLKGNELELEVMDVVGEGMFFAGVTARDIKRQLDENPNVTSIRVLVNSPGGFVSEGMAIHALLKRQTATVEVEVLGEASSIASVIAMAGSRIVMHEGSRMMIHRASTIAWGFADELRKAADALDIATGSIVDIYESRTGLDRAKIEEMVNGETWMTAQEAVKLGFADDIWKGPARPMPKKKAAGAKSDFVINIDTSGLEGVADRIETAINQVAAMRTEPHPAPTAAPETKTMNGILALLGLAATSTEQDAVAAIQNLQNGRRDIEGRVTALEGIAGKTGEEALGALRAFKASHERLPTVEAELAKVTATSEQVELDALLKKGRDDKKLTPAEADGLRAQVEGHWKAKAEGKEPAPEHMSLAAAKAFIAVMAAKPQLASGTEQPPSETGSAHPSATTADGKRFEDVKPSARAEMAQENPELYRAMRADWIARGQPGPKAA